MIEIFDFLVTLKIQYDNQEWYDFILYFTYF